MTSIDIGQQPEQPAGRLLGEPAVGPLGADRAVRVGVHEDQRATTRSSSARTSATRATFCCRPRTTAGRADSSSSGRTRPRSRATRQRRPASPTRFASFLLDVPSLVQRDLKVTDPGVRFWAFFTFIQDKWAVTPKLTVDLGLRHEYYTPFIGLADQGGLSNYDPATNTLQVAGYGGVGESVGVEKYLKNFGPRAGASYRLNDKTVLRGGYGVSTLPFPDNAYVYNYPVKQNNVFNPAEQLRGGRIDEGRIPRSDVRAGSGERDHRREPGRAAERELLPRAARHARRHRCIRSTSRSSASCPARFTLDVAYVGNRGHDTADAVQRKRGDRRRSAGEQWPAAVPAVRQVGGRDHLDRDKDRVQLASGEARSALLRRSPRDVVVHAGTRMELRERRQQQRHRHACRHPAELGAHRSGSPPQPRRELSVSASVRARPEVAARRSAQSRARRLAVERDLHVPVRLADRHHDVRTPT